MKNSPETTREDEDFKKKILKEKFCGDRRFFEEFPAGEFLKDGIANLLRRKLKIRLKILISSDSIHGSIFQNQRGF